MLGRLAGLHALVGAFACITGISYAGLLDTSDPMLKELIADIVFHVSFDDESGDADMSLGDNRAKVEGKPIFEKGISGKAFRDATFRYEVNRNLQIDKPGAISFWLCPYKWVRGDDEPLLVFFMTEYKSDGFLGLERQGQIIRDARVVRNPALILWFHYFKDIPNVSAVAPCDWQDDTWRFIAVTWRGSKWEVFVDGQLQTGMNLPRAIKTDELSKYFLICGSGLMDEFTVYRRPLSIEEIRRMMDVFTGKNW